MYMDFDILKVDVIYILFVLENLCFFCKLSIELWCYVKIKNLFEDLEVVVESYFYIIQVYDDQGNILIDVDILYSKWVLKEVLLWVISKDLFDGYYDVYWKIQLILVDQELVVLKGFYLVIGEMFLLVVVIYDELSVNMDIIMWCIVCDSVDGFN